MAAIRPSLGSFLALARTTLANHTKQKSHLTFVIGNESADLDSLCSALLFAYLRTYTQPQPNLHIPIASVPRPDIQLRPEFCRVLRSLGLSATDLPAIDDLPPSLEPELTQWLLVDHNAMTGPLAKTFASRVVGCIDHHRDEDAIPHDVEPRIIETAGSCASLIVNYCRKAWDDTLKDSHINSDLALLGLVPALIDTHNLTNADKTTPFDEAAVEYLEAKLPHDYKVSSMGNAPYSRDALFDQVIDDMADFSQLSLRDILRKDYKEFVVSARDGSSESLKLGTSCAVHNLSYILDHIDAQGTPSLLIDGIRDWAVERQNDVMIVMTTSRPNNVFTRELLVWGITPRGERAAAQFYRDFGSELQLESWQQGRLDGTAMLDGQSSHRNNIATNSGDWRRAWFQRNLKCSRKQVAPMMREAMQRVV